MWLNPFKLLGLFAVGLLVDLGVQCVVVLCKKKRGICLLFPPFVFFLCRFGNVKHSLNH